MSTADAAPVSHISTGHMVDTIRELTACYWQATTVEAAELYATQILDTFADLDEVLREGGSLPSEWATATR
jgi:hypothetical protein